MVELIEIMQDKTDSIAGAATLAPPIAIAAPWQLQLRCLCGSTMLDGLVLLDYTLRCDCEPLLSSLAPVVPGGSSTSYLGTALADHQPPTTASCLASCLLGTNCSGPACCLQVLYPLLRGQLCLYSNHSPQFNLT